MLKYRIKNSDLETIKRQEVSLETMETKISLDSKLVSGFFNSTYDIKNNATVSLLTKNIDDYKDAKITTQEVIRTGYFTNIENIPILEVKGVVLEDDFIDNGEKTIELTDGCTFILPNLIEKVKRYVQMPNGKIYYELFDDEGNGYFDLDYYTYETSNQSDETLTSLASGWKTDTISITQYYYVDNDIVTYRDIDTIFSDNYFFDENEEVRLKIYDENENEIVELKDYVEYPTPITLTKFEINRLDDTYLDVENVVPARKCFFIEYKDEKYDLFYKDGKWQVDVVIENEKCVKETRNYSLPQQNSSYDIYSQLEAYPTYIDIEGTKILVKNEYRSSVNGDYIFLFTKEKYDMEKNEIITVSYPISRYETFPIRNDANQERYIIYYGKRIYLNKEKYKFTISEYKNDTTDTKFDVILGEFDVELTQSEYIKFKDGNAFRAKFFDDDNNLTEWYVEPFDETSKRFNAYKIGTIIEFGQKSGVSGNSTYKFNVYEYATIDEVDYRANAPLYDFENALTKEPYCLNVYSTNVEYSLSLEDRLAPNWLVCRPKVDAYSFYYYDKPINEETDSSMVENAIIAPYENSISNIVSEFSECEFYIKEPTFGEEYHPTVESTEYQNILDYTDGLGLRLFKKINYISIPIGLGTSVGMNLHQEALVDNEFTKVEKEKAINPIIDMEKDIYYPTIEDENGELKDVHQIKFNLHFRHRDIDNNWKIKENDSWNIFDEYDRTSASTEEINSSDLICFLNFTEDDVFYQKNKIGKSFIRLSFYDSMDENSQNLLHMSTIFMNENMLYKKYISNIDKDVIKYEDDYTYKVYNNLKRNTSTYCSVNTEPVDGIGDSVIDYTKDRLDSSFIIDNRTLSDTCSEGFYIYMFKDYGTKLRPNSIFMKVEFNHAGEGKILPLYLPTKDKDNKLSFMASSLESSEITSLTENEVKEIKQGLPISQVLKSLYIRLNVRFDEKSKRYVYYLPNSYNSLSWKDNVLTFNLWEIKIKDES